MRRIWAEVKNKYQLSPSCPVIAVECVRAVDLEQDADEGAVAGV